MSRRSMVFVAVLGAVAGLAVGSLEMLRWGLSTGSLPVRLVVPSYPTPSTLEKAYRPQIDRLIQLAKDADLRRHHASNNPSDVRLFSPAEILAVRLQEGPHDFRLVSDKSHDYQSRHATFEALPGVNRAVVNLFWDKLADGSRVEVAEYQRRVVDSNGNDIGIILVFDLQRLRVLAEERE